MQMRNLIRMHCKRFLFRWETFAVTLMNLLLMLISFFAASFLYEPDLIFNDQFFGFMRVTTIISVALTMVAVIFIEINTLATGAVRNPLIAGYTKTQVFLSKFIAVGVFSMIEGAIFLIPPVLASTWNDKPVQYVCAMLLVYAAVSCIAMTVCLVTDRPTVYVVVLMGCLIGLFFGGKLASTGLDNEKVLPVTPQHDTMDNPWYVPSPQRDILEQCVRLNPLQPIDEYYNWYLLERDTVCYSIKSMQDTFETIENESYKEYYRIMIPELKESLDRHDTRIALFPLYQTAFLLLFAGGGAVVFRKRNLK